MDDYLAMLLNPSILFFIVPLTHNSQLSIVQLILSFMGFYVSSTDMFFVSMHTHDWHIRYSNNYFYLISVKRQTLTFDILSYTIRYLSFMLLCIYSSLHLSLLMHFIDILF